MDSKRIVLPLPSVKPILKLLHASHSGIRKTTSLAHGLYFWPGMTNDIKQLVSTCPEYTRVLQSQPANPMSTSAPSSHFGFIVSMRPDKLMSLTWTTGSLLALVVFLENSSPPPIVPAQVSPPLLRRSERLQFHANSSANHTSVLPPIFYSLIYLSLIHI